MNRVLSLFRFLLRVVSLLVLAAAVGLAVLDAARSIAAEAWVLTPLRAGWTAFWPDGLARFQAWAGATLPAYLQSSVVQPLLGFPGWAVLGAAALMLGVGGVPPAHAEATAPRAGPPRSSKGERHPI